MRLRAAVPFLVAGLAVTLITAIASADKNRLTDPNDTPGLLDVRDAKWEHVPGDPPAFTVFTFAAWQAGDLWDRGWFFIQLDTMFDDDPEYYVLIRSLGGRMDAELFRIGSSGRGLPLHGVPVWRPSQRAVAVRVPLRLLRFGPSRGYYAWRVVTMFTGEVCPRSCLDRVPNHGTEVQWRPGMSPTPTPTATPTP